MKSTALYLILIGLLTSCGCDEPSYLVDGSSFAFRLVDQTTGENLFTNRFDPFAFEIIDEKGDTVDIDAERYGQNGDYYFFLDPTGGESFRYDIQMRRLYYLHFDSTDIDTLALSFVPRADDCAEYLDDFEAYYNEKLILTGAGKCCYQALAVPKP